jgi:hypothetical protein
VLKLVGSVPFIHGALTIRDLGCLYLNCRDAGSVLGGMPE